MHGKFPSGHSAADTYSVAMRLLIHYVGDQHQPLHSGSRVDHQYPRGDRGGNSFPLPYHYSTKELHAVWDRVLYEFKYNPRLPFSPYGFKKFDRKITEIMARHPLSSLPNTNDLNPNTWEKESSHIVKTFVYEGIKPGKELPRSYIKKGQLIAEKRIVTAGHRLANLLK